MTSFINNEVNNNLYLTENQETSLSVLLITDTHNNKKRLRSLNDKFKREKKMFDLIIHTGDFDSLTKEEWFGYDNFSIEEKEEIDGVVIDTLKYFTEFSYSKCVYFITGNHDSPIYNNKLINIKDEKDIYENAKYFDVSVNNNNITYNSIKNNNTSSTSTASKVCLINNSILEININELLKIRNLTNNKDFNIVQETNNIIELIGLGGSVPTFIKPLPFNLYNDSDIHKHIYDGIPFNNQDTYEEDYLKALDSIFKYRKESHQFILLTHSGSSGLTSNMLLNKKLLEMGSNSLLAKLTFDKDFENMIFNAHGHSHLAQGKRVINNKPIINAGSLVENNYAEIILKLDNVTGEWKVGNIDFKMI